MASGTVFGTDFSSDCDGVAAFETTGAGGPPSVLAAEALGLRL